MGSATNTASVLLCFLLVATATADEKQHSQAQREEKDSERCGQQAKDGPRCSTTTSGGWTMWKTAATVGGFTIAGAVALPVAIPAVVGAMGFGTTGIVAGSTAAKMMAAYGGTVYAGSICATLQSVGAAGLSGVMAAGSAAVGAAVGAVTGTAAVGAATGFAGPGPQGAENAQQAQGGSDAQ